MTPLDKLHEMVQDKAEAFSPAEARLAAHLVEHPDVWGFRPTTVLAQTLNLHRSTIVRFAQRLGFIGFPEMQEAVRTAYLDSVSSPMDLLGPTKANVDQDIVRSVAEREIANLQRTYARLDTDILHTAARALAQASEVLVHGRRFSYAIALNTSLTLRTLRRGVRLSPEPGGSTLDTVFDLGEKDAAIVISLRRHAPSIQRVLAVLSEKAVPTVLLTDASPLADLPPGITVLQAHVGSTSTLDSFTALVSVSHILCTVVAHLLPETDERWHSVEAARTKLQFD